MLAPFEIFSLNYYGLGLPLQCVGLHSFSVQLTFFMITPVAIAALIALGHMARARLSRPFAANSLLGLSRQQAVHRPSKVSKTAMERLPGQVIATGFSNQQHAGVATPHTKLTPARRGHLSI